MLRTMSNMLINRLNSLMSQRGISANRLSLEATGARDTVRKILDGTTKNPRIDTLLKLAAVLDTTPQYLMGEEEASNGQGEQRSTLREAPPLPTRAAMPLDVPVMGTAAGSHTRGAFQFEGGVVDYVRRPPALTGARDIYALFVEGTSMEPQYHPGDLVYISPHKPPRLGDTVIIECKDGETSPQEATIGVLRRRSEKIVVIAKHNPPAEIEINRDYIKSLHKVLTTNELFGI
ncbi:S24 family peptidase [Rhizobium rhizoryzae]|uniref:Phage repressor protein C with HTH and peptisase S24 domain n=1 Tax=Rhizobium rhizoryzae TaxID=451876 RepID=A0A7W6LML3_9HYPH|nr:S24 family peptidase [Rhizobium rhizoryzae]MBB4145856.1 phage repressor protein C with HTH and peptisase S24 domain [Rhizobium rhizoryzae]